MSSVPRQETLSSHPPRRAAPPAVWLVATALVAFGAGALTAASLRRSGSAPARPEAVVDRDGPLPGPVPLSLDGWEISRQPDPDTHHVRCALLQPGQPRARARSGLDGVLVEVTWPRRVKPDPLGQAPARVLCLDPADGRVVASFAVRPRAYVAPASSGKPSAVVSEIPIEAPLLDALARTVAETEGLLTPRDVYLTESPRGGFDRRGFVDEFGDVSMPAELVDGTGDAAPILFQALMVAAMRDAIVAAPDRAAALDRAFARLVPEGMVGQAVVVPRAGVLQTWKYQDPIETDATVEELAASALTVWRFYRAAVERELSRLPAADRATVRAFVTATVDVLARDEDERLDAVEKLVPGMAEFATRSA